MALAAGHKGLRIEWVDVDTADRTPVRELSGQDLVPVLFADGDVVADSPVILEWLEARFPDPPLYRLPETRTFVDWFNSVWKVPPNRLVEGPDPDLERELRGSPAVFEAMLAGRAYLLGEFSAADCVAFPFLKYGLLPLAPEDDDPFHRVLAEHLALDGRYATLAAWIRCVDAHPRA